MTVPRVSILLWTYPLVKEEELFHWWKVFKFLLAALFANARRVDVSKFRVENKAILRPRPRKLFFSKIKGFLREQLTLDYFSSLKLSVDKKWRKSVFQLLPLDSRSFLTVALKSGIWVLTLLLLLLWSSKSTPWFSTPLPGLSIQHSCSQLFCAFQAGIAFQVIYISNSWSSHVQASTHWLPKY